MVKKIIMSIIDKKIDMNELELKLNKLNNLLEEVVLSGGPFSANISPEYVLISPTVSDKKIKYVENLNLNEYNISCYPNYIKITGKSNSEKYIFKK